MNQETDGLYSKPFITPENLDVKALLAKDKAYVKRCVSLNKRILPFVSTANVARDMDGIRAAMGDNKLNYFGFSYGTFLGATYASLFPDNYRAMVLDGPVDANSYINTPSADLREQSAGFERAIGRFFTGLRGLPVVLQLRRHRPAGGLRRARRPGEPARRSRSPDGTGRAGQRRRHPRRDRARDVRQAVLAALAQALSAASHGDGTRHPRPGRRVLRQQRGRHVRSGRRPLLHDRAIEQNYQPDVQTFLDAGDNAWGVFDYTYWNTGYPEINYALWPIHAKDVFPGPFTASKSAADGARGRDDLRPGHAVPRRQAPRDAARQRRAS